MNPQENLSTPSPNISASGTITVNCDPEAGKHASRKWLWLITVITCILGVMTLAIGIGNAVSLMDMFGVAMAIVIGLAIMIVGIVVYVIIAKIRYKKIMADCLAGKRDLVWTKKDERRERIEGNVRRSAWNNFGKGFIASAFR